MPGSHKLTYILRHSGLPVRFVHTEEEALRFCAVFSVKALEPLGGVVESVVNALSTEKQPITIFHV